MGRVRRRARRELSGPFFGLLALALALWRSQAVPRGAVLLIPLFIATDLFLRQGVLGHSIALVGAVWIASAVLLAGRLADPRGGLVGAGVPAASVPAHER